MNDPERPPLEPLTAELIDERLYEVDQRYWAIIKDFLFPRYIPLSKPVPPKRPNQFQDCVLSYAVALYETESRFYGHLSDRPDYPAWLSLLTDRISQRVLNAIDNIENDHILATLWAHGKSLQDIQEALRQRLWEVRTRDSFKDAGPHPVTQSPKTETEKAADAEKTVPAVDPLSDQIRRLKDECDLTADELATALQVEPRSIQRHLSGDAIPRRKHLAVYEEFFSRKLGRTITLKKPHKRH